MSLRFQTDEPENLTSKQTNLAFNRRLDKKLTQELKEFARIVFRDEKFGVLTEEIEKDFYSSWKTSQDPAERDQLWEEYEGFKRLIGKFKSLVVGDGKNGS